MRISTPHSLLLLVLVFGLGSAAPGCMKPNPLAFELGDDDSESSDDSDDGETDEDSEDTDMPGLPDLASGEDTSDNMCAPLDVFESDCASCLGTSCCELALACEAVEDCACLASCLIGGGSNGACKNACNGAKSDMPELEPVLACMDEACGSQCG